MMTQSYNGVYDYEFHLVPPELKTKEWALEYLKTRYPLWTTYFNSTYWNGRVDYNLLRLYGQGRQPESIYYKDFYPDGYMQDSTSGNDWLGMRWNIVSPIPNCVNNLISKVEERTYPDIECEATDELAQNEKEEKKLLLKFQKEIDGFLAEASAKMKLPAPMKSNLGKGKLTPNNPDGMSALKDIEFDLSNDVELGMYMDMYYRNAVEIANEICINTLFEMNEYPEILREQRIEALYFGVTATRNYMDSNTCMPKIEWLQLENIVASWGKRKDYKDSEGWSYNKMMSLNEVISKFGKELDPDKVRKIFAYGVTNYGYWNGSTYNTGWTYTWDKITRSDLDRVKVKVAYFEFKSQNYETNEVINGKHGSKKIKKKNSDYKTEKENATVDYSWAQVVYKGYYVVGMDEIFQYGMLENMVREEGNEQQVMFSLSMYRFAEKSFVEHCIPHANGIQLAFLKFQLELRQSVPSGHAFDIDRLAEIQLGDGKKLNQLEVIRFYSQTGKFPYRSMDEDGNALPMAQNGQLPIGDLPNGVSQAVSGYINAINFHMSQIYQMTGYNPITMEGQLAPPRTSAAATQVAAQGSESVTDYLVKGFNVLIENCARYMGALVQDMATYKGEGWEALKRMVGKENMDVVESMENIGAHRFGIWMKEKVSDEEMNQLKQFVMDAYQKGNLLISDVLLIWFLKDWKQALALANLKIKKQTAKNEQMQMAQMQMQQQQIDSQNQLTAQMKQMEFQTSIQNTNTKSQALLEAEKLKNMGKVTTQQVADQSKSQHIAQQNYGAFQKELLKQQQAA